MWVRKRIEIALADIVAGLGYCAMPADRQLLEHQLEEDWSSDNQAVISLSVRSGFDAMFTALQFPAHSEILMSGLTIPDMPRIVKHHGLVPVPIDLNFPQVAPSAEMIRRSITPRTRAIVIAHLFGGRVELAEIAGIAQEHDLLLIEDCAQAYIGKSYRGSPLADVSMFSFGPIKTNTALYGAIFNVRSTELRKQMIEVQHAWPAQSRLSFVQRLLKYSAVKAISVRPIAAAIAASFRLVGKNHDGFATTLARGFAGGDFFKRIRHQPSGALLKLLARRLRRFDENTIKRRAELGRLFVDTLDNQATVLGSEMIEPTFWVLPVIVSDPDKLVRKLWKAGFDATTSSSLRPVEPTEQWDANEPLNIRSVMKNAVYLPFYYKMSDDAIRRMAAIVNQAQPIRLDELCPRKELKLAAVS